MSVYATISGEAHIWDETETRLTYTSEYEPSRAKEVESPWGQGWHVCPWRGASPGGGCRPERQSTGKGVTPTRSKTWL